ncbi:MAG: glycosyltransferase family 4 protein [Actinomycetota bacterium]|nr:glycosyltransferase family 4 protein [Actinomycetota bacterium]
MRILLWHGYLLSGSGSNIYTANVARAWREQGHAVVVMCQDRSAERYDWVDRYLEVGSASSLAVPADGECFVARPDIGDLLPVYVYDEYEGFTVKTFVELSDAELDTYTERNVEVMANVIERFHPEAIITGHEVMGPYIAKRACETTSTRYIAKLHGSALEYAVKVQERYVHYATEGLTAATQVVGGSEYMLDAAAAAVPGWRERGRVVNPGCDTELFRPAEGTRRGPPTAAFVGKLIVQKGVHHLLAAAGLTHKPGLRLEIVGFGGFADALERLATALQAGDRAGALSAATDPRGAALEPLTTFLEDRAADDAYWTRLSQVPVNFAGRLDHDPLAEVLPDFDVLAVPSVLPEAFGMVAAEAAACGVLPVVPDHSGIAEAGRAVEEHLGRPGFLTFQAADPIRSLASALDRVLALDADERRALGVEAAELAHRRWSWHTVARTLLEIASH